MGVPAEDQARVREWNETQVMLFVPGHDVESQVAAARAVVEYQRYYQELVRGERAHRRTC
jgi:cytochrome P450